MKNDSRKTIQALNYIATSCGNKNMNSKKAIAVLWLADRYHLRHYGRTISYSDYVSSSFGVTSIQAKEILEKLKGTDGFLSVSKNSYSSAKDPNMNVFSKSDIDVLDLMISKFRNESPKTLVSLSKKSPESIAAEKRSDHSIDTMNFFVNMDEKNELFLDDEAFLSITKEMMKY